MNVMVAFGPQQTSDIAGNTWGHRPEYINDAACWTIGADSSCGGTDNTLHVWGKPNELLASFNHWQFVKRVD